MRPPRPNRSACELRVALRSNNTTLRKQRQQRLPSALARTPATAATHSLQRSSSHLRTTRTPDAETAVASPKTEPRSNQRASRGPLRLHAPKPYSTRQDQQSLLWAEATRKRRTSPTKTQRQRSHWPPLIPATYPRARAAATAAGRRIRPHRRRHPRLQQLQQANQPKTSRKQWHQTRARSQRPRLARSTQ